MLGGAFLPVLASLRQSDQFHGMGVEEAPSLPWKQRSIVDCIQQWHSVPVLFVAQHQQEECYLLLVFVAPDSDD